MTLKEEFIQEAQELVPGFNIKKKTDSRFMKILGFLTKPFCPTFMTNFATTIGNTVYLTDNMWTDDTKDMLILLAHELRHAADKKKNGAIPHMLGYLFPQILALLSLLAILAFWNLDWLWSLLFLIFLAPIPSPTRTNIEKRGYCTSVFGYFWVWGTAEDALPWAIKQFTGPSYYFMWPFEKNVEEYFRDRLTALQTAMTTPKGLAFFLDSIEGFVFDFIKANKLDTSSRKVE